MTGSLDFFCKVLCITDKPRRFCLKFLKRLRQIYPHVTLFLSYILCPISLIFRVLKFRVLDHGSVIGNVCTQVVHYVRERRLQRVPWRRVILYPYFAPLFSRRFLCLHACNNYLYHLWKQHFIVITNPIVALLLKPILTAPWLKIERPNFSPFPNESFFAVNRDYYSKYPDFSKETAILKIPNKDLIRGWKTLKNFGISEKDWFVCFYARESGYYNLDDLKMQGAIRNVQVETYEPALLEIIRRGGWCIRMGSEKMKPLSGQLLRHARIIDYPKTAFVSDFMDIFLLATCKFMLTCSSGISMVPGLFGNPIVMTNVIPMHVAKPLHPKDIAILKRYYSRSLKKNLTFPEACSSFLTNHVLAYFYDALHLEVIDNSEKEILAVVEEMLDRLQGSYIEPTDYQNLQKRFTDHIPEYLLCKDGSGTLGYHFLKTHESLLGEQL